MPILPAPVTNLSTALERLPGIGPKTASRLTFFLLRAPDEVSRQLAEALSALKSSTAFCKICFNITSSSQEICDICANSKRSNGSICVVEEPLDVIAIESTAAFNGRYHVLHGVLSPIEGIGPEHLRIKELLERLRTEPVTEIILATNPSMEGDATALYLKQQLGQLGIRITRLARGLPAGGDLEYADQSTLLRALAGRQEM
ncbi:MAG: recombination protein RecR [Leptolinea sp.]|jgi:recombination protein RecR|nr:recombination protein RecR [Leptolinea sp.]